MLKFSKHRIGRYQRKEGKLIHFSHTRPDITYAVNVVNQFMHDPRQLRMDVVRGF